MIKMITRLILLSALIVMPTVGFAAAGTIQPSYVKLETSAGAIVLMLRPDAAPATVANFERYVRSGFYDGTIFHRVIPGFMIQGGGFTTTMQKKQTSPPITNESDNGLHNDRGTIAMARTSDPDSATSQFFINLANNGYLDGTQGRPGYAVFGKVIQGMAVVDAISKVDTTTRDGHQNVPVTPVIIKSAKLISRSAALGKAAN